MSLNLPTMSSLLTTTAISNQHQGMRSTTTNATIDVMKQVFNDYDVPEAGMLDRYYSFYQKV